VHGTIPPPVVAPVDPTTTTTPTPPPEAFAPAAPSVVVAPLQLTPPSADWRVTFDAASGALSTARPAASTVQLAAAIGAPGAAGGPGLVEVRDPNLTAFGFGTALLLAGYIPSVIAAIDLLARPVACNSWGGASFVPVIGGLIGGAGQIVCAGTIESRYTPRPPDGIAVAGILASVVEIVGTILLVVGAATPIVRYRPVVPGVRVAWAPSGLELSF
jgi:hypothetical protein